MAEESKKRNSPNSLSSKTTTSKSKRASINSKMLDMELIELALAGEQKAYAILLNKYKDSVYYLILKMINNSDDADDLTIEAFGKAFNKLDKYSPNYAFSTWLFRIAINNSIDFIRKKKLDTLSIDEGIDKENQLTIGDLLPSTLLDPEEMFIREQRIHLVQEVTDKLNDKYKLLIQKRFFEELSYGEIAEELNLPIGTVKAQLFRAKELLYNILKHTKGKY